MNNKLLIIISVAALSVASITAYYFFTERSTGIANQQQIQEAIRYHNMNEKQLYSLIKKGDEKAIRESNDRQNEVSGKLWLQNR